MSASDGPAGEVSDRLATPSVTFAFSYRLVTVTVAVLVTPGFSPEPLDQLAGVREAQLELAGGRRCCRRSTLDAVKNALENPTTNTTIVAMTPNGQQQHQQAGLAQDPVRPLAGPERARASSGLATVDVASQLY